MIKISNLSKRFNDKEVLRNLNLEIKDGEIFGLVGINGAGKSTLLRLISGIYKADEGSIIIDEAEVYENEEVKSQMFFLPDEPYYAVNTTPLTLISLYETFYDLDKQKYLNYLKMFSLPIEKSMHNFSKGMKRQVFISLALAIKPKYLLLDEAFDGLDPLARLTFKRELIELVESQKTTVIISSHSLRELEDICDCYGLIDNMEISSSGNISETIEKYHKYQVAFEHIVDKDDFDINFVMYQQDKRIIKVVVRESYEEFSEKIKHLNPLIVDEIKIDFEELFIIQVESRGYLDVEND